MASLPTDTYLVCTDCGFIAGAGGKLKLNAPAMLVLKNNMLRREQREAREAAAFKKRQERIQEIMNALIRTHVENLGNDLHKNIEVLQQFFRKSSMELDSLYVELGKDLEEQDNCG